MMNMNINKKKNQNHHIGVSLVQMMKKNKMTMNIEQAKSWIELAHGIRRGSSSASSSINRQQQENRNALLNFLGFEEKIVDVDYFLDMAASDSKYSFSMLHPQTLPQFLNGLWEMYDDFFKKEVVDLSEQTAELQNHIMRLSADERPQYQSADFNLEEILKGGGENNPKNSKDDAVEADAHDTSNKRKKVTNKKYSAQNLAAAAKYVSKRVGRGGVQGPSPFNSPRGIGLHFWDNYEITSLEMFRRIKYSDARDPEQQQQQQTEKEHKRSALLTEEDVADEQIQVESAFETRRNLQLPPSLTTIRTKLINSLYPKHFKVHAAKKRQEERERKEKRKNRDADHDDEKDETHVDQSNNSHKKKFKLSVSPFESTTQGLIA